MIKHGQNWNSQFTETESALKPNVGGISFAKKTLDAFQGTEGYSENYF